MNETIQLRDPKSTHILQSYETVSEVEKDEMFLHSLIEQLTPEELLEVLKSSSEQPIQIESNTEIVLSTYYSNVYFTSAIEQHEWSNDSSTDEILIKCIFSELMINDSKTVLSLSSRYYTGQLHIEQDYLVYTTKIILKGGRNTENFLWGIISFLNDAERIHKDLSIFSE